MGFSVEAVARTADALGEGAVWDAGAGRLRWTDIEGRRLHAFDPATGRTTTTALPERLGCFAVGADGALVAAFEKRVARLDPSTGAVATLAAVEPDLLSTRANDGRADRRGRLVFGTLDDGERPIGAVYAWDAAQGLRRLFGEVAIANGIAFSPDGRRMFFADTPTKRIDVFDYDPDEARVGARRTFATVDGPGWPDGATVDAEGCLWSAEWDGRRVVRYTPDGRVDRAIPVPCRYVTCCAFGGPRLDTLYVTSARWDMDAAALAGEPLAGALFAVVPGVTGLPDAPAPAAPLGP